MTNTAYDTAGTLLAQTPEALQLAAKAASRQIPSNGALEVAEPQPLTATPEELVGPGAQALTVDVTGAATGLVSLIVSEAVATALQEGPLAAADLTSGLITPITDAVTALEPTAGGSLRVGMADAVEAHAIDFGPDAIAVTLSDATAVVAVLVLQMAESAVAPSPAAAPAAGPAPADDVAFTPFVESAPPSQEQRSLELLHDVEMAVTVELGRTRMAVSDLLSLAPGAVVELDRAAGSPVDVLVNGKLIARGEVVVIDEDFGIRISEIVGLHQNRS